MEHVASAKGVALGMNLKRKLFRLLGGENEPLPELSDEPYEIGYVPLVLSELFASGLREAGFRATAVAETRVGPIGSIPLQPMARIYVPKKQAAQAQVLLDEMVCP